MLNHIWAAMLMIGFLYGMVTGNLSVMTDSMLSAAKDAVDLCITLLGVVAFWCGITEIAQETGLIEILSRKMRPIIHFLFPEIPEEHESLKAISLNFIANILGLGWAATPAGLKAMENLAELEEERRKAVESEWEVNQPGVDSKSVWKNRAVQNAWERYRPAPVNAMQRGEASNEMCTFLILNISSLQLIPVNIIAYRSQYGSINPTLVVGPAIAATTVSTVIAIIFCKIMNSTFPSHMSK